MFHKLSRPVNVESLYFSFAPSYDADFYFEGERHNFWECVFVVDGKVGVAEDDRLYELSKNDIIFHKPMEFHRIWSANKTNPKLIITSFTADGFGMENLSDGVFHLNDNMFTLMEEIQSLATENILKSPLWEKDYISQQLLSNRLEALMLHILKDIKASVKETETISAKNYKKIVKAMNDNIDKNLTINDLSRMTNLSSANLKKSFKKFSGMGVINYFNHLKITKAELFLKQGYSISEISDMLGYSCQSYFSTAFKRELGMSPMEYKKNMLS